MILIRAIVISMIVLASSVSIAIEPDHPKPFEGPGLILGFGFAGDERIYLDGKGVFFYGFETSLDFQLHSSPITLGLVGSFEFFSEHTGNVLMVAEPGLRIGVLIRVSDEIWLHPYVVAGPTILCMVVEEKCDIDGHCYSTNMGVFGGGGTGVRWMMSDDFGLSADFVLSYSYGDILCVKFRAGVVFPL